MNRKRNDRVGRNDPCPCNSGKKYKRCHGAPAVLDALNAEAVKAQRRFQASAVQRARQQGLGKPIISAEFKGRRFVAIKNRLVHGKWRTFHDFLFDYIKLLLGSKWGNFELARPLSERHPILLWYDYLCRVQQEHMKGGGKVSHAPMTGAIAAYLWLAYDLYCLDHNAEVQDKLLGRLRDKQNFAGARYEVFAAATLVRAGFTIEFENEDLRDSTHCEFTATSRETKRKYSVECKRRDSGTSGRGEIKLAKLGRKLRDALSKSAKYERIVFIDVNVADKSPGNAPKWMKLVGHQLRKFEANKANSGDLPSAFLVFSNHPYAHFLTDTNIQVGGYMDSFNIPEFIETKFRTLREAINNREKFCDLHKLVESLKHHSVIPSTFDGDIPEFAFGDASSRLLVGARYLVQDEDGKDRVGTITSAVVVEHEKRAYCGVSLESGESVVLYWPLTDAEMAAWASHPDTFFGDVQQRSSMVRDPLDMYDRFLATYSRSSREKLLHFMASHPDPERLKKLSQPELASMYCEGMVNAFMADHQRRGINPFPLQEAK